MMPRRLIEGTEAFLRERLGTDATGHDWHHTDRVRRTAMVIGTAEGADLRVVELAALLHDVADWKFHGGDDQEGPRVAREWLLFQEVPPQIIELITTIIREISFKGAGVDTRPTSLEASVVQDADRLDALGAIGIARAFAYGGHKGQALYDPAIAATPHATFEDYQKHSRSTINHFYEKLLLLKDRLNTHTARQIAATRHQFMEQFLSQFYREWNGEDWRPWCA
jgi:uncharacterized protein